MTLSSILSKTMSAWILSIAAIQALAAPLDSSEPETPLITIEFVLLHATDEAALTTEAWNSPLEARTQIQAEIDRRRNLETEHDQYAIETKSTGELIAALQPVLRRGQFNILYSTLWQQPKSQKHHTHDIESSIGDFGAYNLAFGKLKLEERSALVAKLNINVVDTLSLATAQDELTRNEQLTSNKLTTEVLELKKLTQNKIPPIDTQALTSSPPQELAQNNVLQEDSLEITQSTPAMLTPLLFLNQQRQIKPNKIHYFDHPVIPGFLLVSYATAPAE